LFNLLFDYNINNFYIDIENNYFFIDESGYF